MTRGRRPVPSAILRQRGSHKRYLNEHEPTHAALDVSVPKALEHDIEAAAEWQRVAGDLAHGHVTKVDRATLMAYCRKYAQWIKYERDAAAHPDIYKSPSGYAMQSPYIAMANKACGMMLRLAVELGITPSSRARIINAPVDEATNNVDEFTAFQRKRRMSG